MHIGNFLTTEFKKRKISIADIARKVNKSDTGVRKDLEKDSLHQSVIESYSKVLGLNIYAILAEDYDGKEIDFDGGFEEYSVFNDSVESTYQKKVCEDNAISITFTVPSSKKEQLIKLLSD